MAQQKMLDAFQETCKDIEGESRSNTLSSDGDIRRNKSIGKSKIEDTESSFTTRRNYSSRCTVFVSSNPGPNGHKFVVVPTHSTDSTNSSTYSEINKEDLDMIASFSAGSLKFRERMIIGGTITAGDCSTSGESIIARSHKRPQFLHLPSIKGLINGGSKWKVLPFSSLCQSRSISIEYPLVLSCKPGTLSSAYRLNKGVDDYKAVQRNPKRKASRRRGKCNDLSRTHTSAILDSENETPQAEDDKTKGMCTVSISRPYMKETVSRINQNTTATDAEMQQLVKFTLMVATSENGLLDDGNDRMDNSTVTFPDIYKSVLPALLSPASDGGETCGVQRHEKLSNEDMPHSDIESSNLNFMNNCVRQTIDRDRKPCALEKKEYKSKKVPHNSSVRRHSSLGNLNLHYGKENTHSIWKKVEKNVVDGHSYKNDMQSTNVCTLVRTHHKHHSVPNSCFLSKSEDANMTQPKASKKTKRRKDLVSKQELHSTCITESHSIKGCSCVCSSSAEMKKTELSGSRQNLVRYESRSFPKKNSSAIFQAKRVESTAYKSFHEPETVNPVAPSQSSNSVDPVTIFHVTERHCDLPSRQISFPGTPDVHKEDSFVDDNIMTVKELSATNYCKEKMCSAVMAENCISVGVNSFSECNLGQSGSQLEALKLSDESLPLEGFEGQKSFCSPHLPPYPVEAHHSLARMSGDEISIKKSELIDACAPKINCNNTATNGIPCELKNPVLFSSASDMVNVFQAANDAYRVQLASEAIQSITGSPIAEFEKFIYSASPVLYGALDINNCKECSPLHALNAPLCEDETSNLALGNIWRWYEKHGAFGMEVRAMDHEHSVRLGTDQFGFRAYFVPYLSAVQLFRKCKAHTNDIDVCSQETDSRECSSTVGLTSILRKLVPQPCSVNSSTFSKTSQVPHKEASVASMNNKINNECKAHTNDTDVCSQETELRECSTVGLTSILQKLVPQPCSVSKTSQVPHKEASFASMNNKINNECKAHTNDTDVCSRETDSRECSSTVGLTSILRKLVPQPCSVNSSTFSKTSQVPHKEASFASMNNKFNNECKAHTNDTDACSQETVSRECSSTVGLTSILQKLVPQPCSVNSSTFSNTSQVPHKAASFTSINNTINNKQSDLRSTDGVELLFEYFENDQPQQRRPLFEMIKELSNGHIPLKSRVHGDPRTLDSLNLNDLHRNSWYSVAWYPIYRIPDGKLRAAFLTYHSLGHLVRRSPKHDSHSMEVSIVSPVVGLQCYSAQEECWFNPRKPTGLKTSSRIYADSSHVLKERIRTLERTASVMARTTVTAGGQTYVNRQPDYEFFLSKRR